MTSQTQLHLYSEQQRAFGIGNICYFKLAVTLIHFLLDALPNLAHINLILESLYAGSFFSSSIKVQSANDLFTKCVLGGCRICAVKELRNSQKRCVPLHDDHKIVTASLRLYHKYTREIPEPVHGAQIRDLWVFPVIKVTVVRQVHMSPASAVV